MKIISVNKGLRVLFYSLALASLPVSALARAHTSPSFGAYFQQTISGTVSDGSGPLPGAAVVVKGSGHSTITDAEGKFSIAAAPDDILIVSFVGFKTVELPVGAQAVINVALQEDHLQLEEVTINAGYYNVKQKESTGSISRITAKDIKTQPVPNVLATMQGRMAGVDVTQTTGVPGGGFDIRIRGLNSLRNNGNAPLYIIDGVPFSSDPIGDSQTSTTLPAPTSPLNAINPGDIESIEILKDADATAIYGSRGANGVVLITTKKGKAGATSFSVSASTAVGQVTRQPELLTTQQYLEIRRRAFANDGITEYPANAYDVNGTWDQQRYTDWQEELTGGTANITTLQGTVAGGSESTRFLISGNLYRQGTVYPGDFDYKKSAAHVSLDHESADKRFKIVFSGSYDFQDNEQPAADLTRISRTLAPNAPALYDENGELNWENSTWSNPLAALRARAFARTNNLIASSQLSYRLPYNFIIKANVGYNDVRNLEKKINPSTIYDPAFMVTPRNSSLIVNNTARRSWIIEPQLNWNYDIGSQSTIDVIAGATFQNQENDRLVQFGSGFSSNSLIQSLASATTLRVFSNELSEYKYQAFFGRVHFSHKGRYFINLTGRRDGSSRFGPGKQFANFGAVGANWIFSREGWVENHMGFLSFGKLRASYGITGNDQIGDYQFLDTYQSVGNNYNGVAGLQPTRLYNPDFGWETNRKVEVATELGFFNDRLFTTVSYYRNRSSNQLVGIPMAATTGFASMQANLNATVQNTGLEITLRSVNISRDNFEWTTGFNITLPENKLIAFPGLETSTYRNQYVIGESIGIRKLYNYTGINPETGIYEFEDVNGDGSLTLADDAKEVRDFMPEYYGGISNQLRFRNFELDFLFQFVKQLNWNAQSQFNTPGTMGNQPVSVLGSWGDGPSAANQAYTTGVNSDAVNAYARYANSTAAVEDASFIRLKNVSVSYRIPTIKGMQCRVYLQGQNLLTFTKYSGGDPEFRNYNYLPPLRIFSLGTEIKF